MNVIPKVKNINKISGTCNVSALSWNFDKGTDRRVIDAAMRISNGEGGTPVYVSHENESSEEYTLTILPQEIKISAPGAAGAFYALSTLKMLIKNRETIKCCEILDSPDMLYRGFYQDTARGRIPTLDTLKKLVDTMADFKLNSLQLYVEHSYDFKEYDFCKEQLGYLTKAEVMELDEYCRERFIELVPSLSTFGHLYHLLQSDKYKHLCELRDYEPQRHHFFERMPHHTINPLLPESFEVITSLIDQHMEAFTSDKFNICCDETFDLGTDVNRGEDKAEMYIGFVKKLVNYLEKKGKTVMMWSDIVLQYPEKISELSDKIIFLNWDYSKDAEENKFEALKDKTQIVCPGTSAWEGFHEYLQKEEGNILKLAGYGEKYGAVGILNTNWGDMGNPASIDMSMYGLILGAAAGWDTKTKADADFKNAAALYHYGCSEAADILEKFSEIFPYAHWLAYQWGGEAFDDGSLTCFEKAQKACVEIIKSIEKADFEDSDIKEEFLLAAKSDSLLIKWYAKKYGHNIESPIDFNEWTDEYRRLWLKKYKPSELDELIKVFEKVNAGGML